MKAPGSCQEYFDNLVRDDGVYPIQPSLDYDPFNVTCTFNETSGIATTILFHEHDKQFQYTSLPGSSDGCADPGCFRDKITYDANVKQLQALIDISDNCYQTILHNCTSNAITSFSWWVDRFGNNVTYWNGDKEVDAEGCACSEDDSCDTGHGGGADNLCNCDDRDNMNIDYGILTSRDQLPVMELAYGDSQYRYSWIHYTLGQFTCEGKRWIYPSEIHDNDFAVKVGWTYGPSCNYNYLSTSCSKIDFNQIIYDRSLGSWNINTFTAPVDGFYQFNLHFFYYKSGNVDYRIILNRKTESTTQIGKQYFSEPKNDKDNNMILPNRIYSTVHKIVHLRFKLLVRNFMCFDIIWIIHVSSHSILLEIIEIIFIVHCSSQPISRNHNFSTNCTKFMIARGSLI